MNFFCIADADTTRGIGLAGVAGQAVTTPAEAIAALQSAVNDANCGIIVITEPVAVWIRKEIEEIRFQQFQPVIIEIPGRSGPLQGRKSLLQLVQEAVGIRLGNEDGK